MKALILAGGKGTRLWPLSRRFKPKQFQKLVSDKTMLQETFDRILPLININDIYVATNKQYTDEVRKERIDAMEPSKKRVLIATDCLSEGINLQEYFTAVLHYDLPWNPNRLEQREGRVDRFGQPKDKVKAYLLYGKDNPIDGAVLRVILQKVREIKKATGISMPFPEKSSTIMDAILHAVLLNPKHIQQSLQTILDFGDDEVLKEINKGVTAEEHILAGKKIKEAGIELSEYVMPGLGGRAKWKQHAENTARVLNEIDPDFIRLRPLVPRRVPNFTIPLFEDYESGKFELTSPHERLRENKLMVENLEITGRLCFDHFLNAQYEEAGYFRSLFSQDYNGYKFPEQKSEVLELIDTGLTIDESRYMWAKDLISLPNF